jgi:hypothetical protein
MPRALVFAALVALLAGCASPAAPQDVDDPAGDEQEEPAEPVVLPSDKPFSWAAGAGAPGGIGQNAAADDVARVNVPADAARINLTIRWTCATPAPACDLQAQVCEPKSAAAQRAPCAVAASGASPLAVDVVKPTPGEWTITMRASGADAAVTGVIHSEVRPGTPPPAA